MQAEKIIETKICRQCSVNFDITDRDLEFYEKISPIFNGVRHDIPSPTLCPDCRTQRRIAWRNRRNIYKRKCDISGKDIISMYNPDVEFPVYDIGAWYNESYFNGLNYGMDFDFSKTFTENFGKLLNKVPRSHAAIALVMENSEFCNGVNSMKNCYLCFNAGSDENCYYSDNIYFSKDSIDNLGVNNSERLYECNDCVSCFDSKFLENCSDCSNSYFLKNCVGCNNCFGCKNLSNKEYHIFNEVYEKDVYFEKIEQILNGKYSDFIKIKNEVRHFFMKYPDKNLYNLNSPDSTGDHLVNCKNCIQSFDSNDSEDCKFCLGVKNSTKYSYDISFFGGNFEKSYESVSVGINSYSLLFCENCYTNVSNLLYCSYCLDGSSNCFGCVGLRNQHYCIMNKQYTKEEYESLVSKIIEHMKNTGEWGEFFPLKISPFGYNETSAQEYFEINEEKALEIGAKWSNYIQPFPKIEKIIPAEKLPDDISDIPDDILNWAIKCEITGKPFKIIKQELEFYRKNNLPIPRRHPEQRYKERRQKRNACELYSRNCDKCGRVIATSYSPNRLEVIYCEECYNKDNY